MRDIPCYREIKPSQIIRYVHFNEEDRMVERVVYYFRPEYTVKDPYDTDREELDLESELEEPETDESDSETDSETDEDSYECPTCDSDDD
jgi:hypothetical protein